MTVVCSCPALCMVIKFVFHTHAMGGRAGQGHGPSLSGSVGGSGSWRLDGIAALAVSCCIPYALSYCILYGFQRECFCAFQGNLQRNFAYCIMAFTLPSTTTQTPQRCGRVAARAIVPTLGAQLPCHCSLPCPAVAAAAFLRCRCCFSCKIPQQLLLTHRPLAFASLPSSLFPLWGSLRRTLLLPSLHLAAATTATRTSSPYSKVISIKINTTH